MRRLLLAFCLLPALTLAAASASAEPSPPRDEIVPEGIEGLTPKRMFERAVELMRAGDVVRGEALMRASADRGNGAAAGTLARLLYERKGHDWRKAVERYARIAISARPRFEPGYVLLAAVLDDDPSAQGIGRTDLLYRIFALMMLSAYQDRVDLQKSFAGLAADYYESVLLPPKLERAIRWADPLVRGGGQDLYAAYLQHCSGPASPLAGLEFLAEYCRELLYEAAYAEQPDARVSAAYDMLENDPGGRHEYFAQVWLCQAAAAGDAAAALRLARRVLIEGHRPRVLLIALAFVLIRTDASSLGASDLVSQTLERLKAEETRHLEALLDDPDAVRDDLAC
jgi:hypothetical protein